MTTKPLSLIKQADGERRASNQLNETITWNLSTLAERNDTSAEALAESVTHVLSNIAATAGEGAQLKLMHLRSVAAFMAGVDAIAQALPKAQDPQRVSNTIRALQAAKVGPDGLVTTAAAPIAQLGASKTELMAKYDQLVNDYAKSVDLGRPNGQPLVQAARALQMNIDRAMRSAAAPAQANTAPAPGQ